MSKVIEIIMFKRLEMHLETNDILTAEQFGFRKGEHIDSTIFNLTNNIPYCSDRKTQHDFSLDILEKNNDECISILVIYWKKTGLVHTKISNRNIIYSS